MNCLFDCFVHCKPRRPFSLLLDDDAAGKSRLAPIIDILIVNERDVDVCI